MADYYYVAGGDADTYKEFHTSESPSFYIKGYVNSDGKYYFYIYAHVGYYNNYNHQYGYNMTFEIVYTDVNGKSRTIECSDAINQPYLDDSGSKHTAIISGTLDYKPTSFNLNWYCDDPGCDNGFSGTVFKVDEINQYTKPTNFSAYVQSFTGTTITVKASWTSGSDTSKEIATIKCYYKEDADEQFTQTIKTNGGTCTFTDLTPARTYNLEFDFTDGTTKMTDEDATLQPMYTRIADTTRTATKLSFTLLAYGVKNKTNEVPAGSIYYYVKEDGTSNIVRSGTVSNNTTITIDATDSSTYNTGNKLKPNTRYYIYARANNSSNVGYKNTKGEYDAVADRHATTLEAVSNATYTIDSTSGTTTTITPTFTLNGSKSGTITLYYKQTTASSFTSVSNITKDEPYTIVDLDNGESYTIFIKVTDEAGNYSTSAYMSTVTYKVDTTLDDISTQAFKFTPTVTHGGNKNRIIEYKITGGDTGDGITGSCNSGDSVIVGKLKHGTMHTIEAWIKDMVDEHGDIDTQMVVMSATKRFRVICTSQTATLNTISTVVRAQMSVSEYLYEDYDKCHLTNDLVEFVLDECKNNPYKHDDEDGYTYNTPTDGADSLTGDYQKDYTILTTGEPWTYYYIVVCVTDGYNKAYVTAPCHTLFPYVKVFVDGEWKDAIPFIYTDGKWINAMPYKYSSNNWKL